MNIKNDTIASIATAYGIGAISIIRVSGPSSLKIAKIITKRDNFNPRYAHLCNVYDKDTFIDKAIVIYFKAPFSFTGEDIVEFQLHGGIGVSNLVLDIILQYARVANPGEFSKRAFLNNKIDLSQAQAISKIIEAKSSASVKLIAKQLRGDLKELVEKIRKDILFALAHCEVSIDYAEDDIPEDIKDTIYKKLKNIEKNLISLVNKTNMQVIDGFKVAIVGKPNVGKSSLLNKLLNYNRAIVSDIAGTTRDTIEEEIKIGSHIIKIIDTAGIRNASDEIEKIGIDRTKDSIEKADIVIALFDNSKVFDESDKEILKLIKDKDTIFVLNKIDLEKKLDIDIKFDVKISTKENIEPLIDVLKDYLNKHNYEDNLTLISKQQLISTKNTLNNIQEAFNNIDLIEIFAFYLQEALKEISFISKPFDNDEMLDIMFSEFCLGK